MSTETTKLVGRTWVGRQSLNMEVITQVVSGPRTWVLRCTICRDSYDFQSYAVCDVLKTAGGTEWSRLHDIPYPNLASLHSSPYTHTPEWGPLKLDADHLLADSIAILEATL